jgi:L-threonylcarbamoyladenylate synthase
VSYLADSFDGRIVELLAGGAVGFMPSDTVYGLSAQALNKPAVQRLHKIKERDEHKPFIVLISDFKMLNMLSIDEDAARLAIKYWPGALTIICSAPRTPLWLSLGSKTLAIRMPDNDELRELISKVGPLISTSANKQGARPVSSANEAQEIFGSELDFYVDIGKIVGETSTIVKPIDGHLKIIRSGTVKIDEKEQTV